MRSILKECLIVIAKKLCVYTVYICTTQSYIAYLQNCALRGIKKECQRKDAVFQIYHRCYHRPIFRGSVGVKACGFNNNSKCLIRKWCPIISLQSPHGKRKYFAPPLTITKIIYKNCTSITLLLGVVHPLSITLRPTV